MKEIIMEYVISLEGLFLSFFFLFLISLFFILPLLGKYLTKTCLKLASSNILYDG